MAVRFLVRLLNKEGLTSKDIGTIVSRSITRLKPHYANVGNIRVSKNALEMDLFPPNIRDSTALTHLLEQEFGEILTLRQLDLPTPPPTSSRELIASARHLFNEERYWETHEEVEALWKTKKAEEKELLQGFILVAVAFVHLQKDEPEICMSVLKRAMRKLEGKPDTYEQMDVKALRTSVQIILENGMPAPFRV